LINITSGINILSKESKSSKYSKDILIKNKKFKSNNLINYMMGIKVFLDPSQIIPLIKSSSINKKK
jgi:hypothetical protein